MHFLNSILLQGTVLGVPERPSLLRTEFTLQAPDALCRVVSEDCPPLENGQKVRVVGKLVTGGSAFCIAAMYVEVLKERKE
jgi:hypothetical protein